VVVVLQDVGLMAIRLMSTRGMPDDELGEICSLLQEHDISFLVTPPGNWLISAGSILLRNEQQLDEARALLSTYQQHRAEQQRKDYTERCQQGEQESLLRNFISNPLQFIGYLVIIIFLLYLSIKPFFDFGH
jgi:hypothetical protein